MAKRSQSLDRLSIGSPCTVPSAEMSGEGARRFCASCQRDVFDFALLTPRQARARLQASRGHLCAKLTRRGGHLTLAPEPSLVEVMPSSSWHAASATALVTAFLTLGTGPAQASESTPGAAVVAVGEAEGPAMDREPNDAALASQAVTSEIRGRLVDDAGAALPGAVIVARCHQAGVEVETVTDANGELSFAGLPAGQYDLTRRAIWWSRRGWFLRRRLRSKTKRFAGSPSCASRR